MVASCILTAIALSMPAHAETVISGPFQISGQMGVGTNVPGGHLGIDLDSQSEAAIRVSSPGGAVMLIVNTTGQMGVGLPAPQARLDINGEGDNGDLGLLLRAGNSSQTISSSQIVFANNSTDTFSHNIRSQHDPSERQFNNLRFFLWRSIGDSSSLGGVEAIRLTASTAGSLGSVHIMPVGASEVELVVSDGITHGGGIIHAASFLNPSSKSRKADISYLGPEDDRKAYTDIKSLRHATYRYRGGNRTYRGLIFEDAPNSIKWNQGKGLIVNHRVANLEMALKEAYRRMQALEVEIARLEAGGTP